MDLQTRFDITDQVTRLFTYTDRRNWDGLRNEVFASELHVDMTSLGAPEAATMTATALTEMWDQGFTGLAHIHHQWSNLLLSVDGDSAAVECYSIVYADNPDAANGTTRVIVGTYDLHFAATSDGWRLDSFVFHHKLTDGNPTLD